MRVSTRPHQKICCRSVNIHLKFAHQTNSSISSACNKQANVLEKQSISWRRTSTYRNNHIVSHFLQEQLVELQTTTNMHGVTQHLVHLGRGDCFVYQMMLPRERYDDACLWTGRVWSAAIIHYGCSWLFNKHTTALNKLDHWLSSFLRVVTMSSRESSHEYNEDSFGSRF